MTNTDLEHVPRRKRESKPNFFLDRLTIFAITAIVMTELISTNGQDAKTAWLFIPYGVFYLLRIILILVREAGSVQELFEGENTEK